MSTKDRQRRLYDYVKSLGLYVRGVPIAGQDVDGEIDYISVSVKDPRPAEEDRPYLTSQFSCRAAFVFQYNGRRFFMTSLPPSFLSTMWSISHP